MVGPMPVSGMALISVPVCQPRLALPSGPSGADGREARGTAGRSAGVSDVCVCVCVCVCVRVCVCVCVIEWVCDAEGQISKDVVKESISFHLEHETMTMRQDPC